MKRPKKEPARERVYVHFSGALTGAPRAVAVDRLSASLARSRVRVDSLSSSGMVASGTPENLAAAFQMSMGTVQGRRGPVRAVELSRHTRVAFSGLIQGIITDHPLVACGNWRNPSDGYVEELAETWAMGPNYSPSDEPNNLLQLTDTLAPVGALKAYFNQLSGDGVTIYMVDTGVDLDAPFFRQYVQEFPIDEHLELRYCLDHLQKDAPPPSLEGDFNGHGTMCASGALSMAPGARVVMYTIPKTWDTLYGTLSLVDFLSAFGKIRDDVSKNSPALLSISRGFSAQDFIQKDGSYMDVFLDTVDAFRDHLNALLKNGVVTFASAGNELPEHEDLVPCQMSEVLSVGGAYPTDISKKAVTDGYHFLASNHSISGNAPVPISSGFLEASIHGNRTRPFPDLCGIEGTLGGQFTMPLGVAPGYQTGGKVAICCPVSRGMSPLDWNHWMESLPPVQEKIEESIQAAGCAPWDEACIQSATAEAIAPYLPLLYSLSPMDQAWVNYGGTAPDDGWAVSPGGTSMATAFCAGIFALALEQFPTFPQGDFAPATFVVKLRKLIYSSCVDVYGGVNGSGEEASPGKCAATGAGVLHFEALHAQLTSLESLMDLSGIDRFKPEDPARHEEHYRERRYPRWPPE